jgi:hypothetical protein
MLRHSLLHTGRPQLGKLGCQPASQLADCKHPPPPLTLYIWAHQSNIQVAVASNLTVKTTLSFKQQPNLNLTTPPSVGAIVSAVRTTHPVEQINTRLHTDPIFPQKQAPERTGHSVKRTVSFLTAEPSSNQKSLPSLLEQQAKLRNRPSTRPRLPTHSTEAMLTSALSDTSNAQVAPEDEIDPSQTRSGAPTSDEFPDLSAEMLTAVTKPALLAIPPMFPGATLYDTDVVHHYRLLACVGHNQSPSGKAGVWGALSDLGMSAQRLSIIAENFEAIAKSYGLVTVDELWDLYPPEVLIFWSLQSIVHKASWAAGPRDHQNGEQEGCGAGGGDHQGGKQEGGGAERGDHQGSEEQGGGAGGRDHQGGEQEGRSRKGRKMTTKSDRDTKF